jgi:hypothetical protein
VQRGAAEVATTPAHRLDDRHNQLTVLRGRRAVARARGYDCLTLTRIDSLLVSKFDAWARRGVQVVWTDQAEREYAAWLVDYANAWIESMARLFASHPPPFAQDVILADLRRRLGARGASASAPPRSTAS